MAASVERITEEDCQPKSLSGFRRLFLRFAALHNAWFGAKIVRGAVRDQVLVSEGNIVIMLQDGPAGFTVQTIEFCENNVLGTRQVLCGPFVPNP